MLRLLPTLIGLLALVACKDRSEPIDSGDSAQDSALPEVDTSALTAALEAALPDAPEGVEGMALVVHDAQDRRVIELVVGDFDLERPIAVASASKLVSALVTLRLVEEGALSLDDTTGEVLGWTGPQAAITLDQLGAFTSGLPGEDLCAYNPLRTLEGCVDDFSGLDLTGAPGEVFEYGPVHMAVMGRMAEVATGESWAELFERTLTEPLGITHEDLRYVTLPQQDRGVLNPLIAGGLRASVEQYLRILGVLFHQGALDGQPWIGAAHVARMSQNPYADAQILGSPMVDQGYDFRYSFGSWLECAGEAAECSVISSAGAFGLTPWVDLEHGYYAVLAMESEGTTGAQFSFPLAQALQPMIREALSLD